MAEKRKCFVDNVELPGLTKAGPMPLDEITIEVPGYGKVRTIQSGTIKIPPVDLTFRVDRSTRTRKFLNSWKTNKEIHDVLIVQGDASGQEFGRYLLPQCGLSKLDPGEADLGSPTYAHLDVVLVPWDLVPTDPQQ